MKRDRPTFRRPVQPTSSDVKDQPEVSSQDALVIRTTAYLEALHQAWFATALEQTKSIFTLASAGVGLALTLLFSTNEAVSTWIPGWFLSAATAFALAAVACICVFRINGDLVKTLIRDEVSENLEAFVRRMHRASLFCFVLGILFLLAAALAFILFGKGAV